VLTEGGKSVAIRPEEAMAIGKVDVVDPDGSFQASSFWFTWDEARRNNKTEMTGLAEGIQLRIGTANILAERVLMTGEGFDFTHVKFWTGTWKTPLFKFEAASLFLYPGKRGIARKMQLSFLGVPLPQIAKYTFSLDPRSKGLKLPIIGFRQGAGIGLNWQSDIAVGDSKNISATVSVYPQVLPSYSVSYAFSNVSSDKAVPGAFYVPSQFGERAAPSYFCDITTTSIDSSFDSMRQPKSLFAVSSSFNDETFGRPTDRITNYSIPLEFVFDSSGPVGSGAFQVQARASRIVEAGSKSALRTTISANGVAPLLKLGRFTSELRFDSSLRLDSSTSGWAGFETGLSYSPLSNFSLSVGGYGYRSFGKPLFLGDEFRTNQGYCIRGDWFGSSTNISLMYRYDPTQGWFDRQYRLSQVMGPIEPVLIFRESPRQYALGILIRTQDLSKLLARRKFRSNNEGVMQEHK
jgi:hypothetical protein